MPAKPVGARILLGRFRFAAASRTSSRLHRQQSLRSGLKSISLAFQEIATGNLECVLAGGTESMSRLPYYLEARWGFRLGNQELVDGMYRDGFFCPMAKMVMGETAEVLAEQYKISREEQDQFALCSQTRAAAAIAAGRFNDEIVPVQIESKKGPITVAADEHPFVGASLEKLRSLRPSSPMMVPSPREIPPESPTERLPWFLPARPS